MRIGAMGPGAAARLEGHTNGSPAAEPVLVTVRGCRRPSRGTRIPAALALVARSALIVSLVRDAGSLFPFAKCRGRSVRHRMHARVMVTTSPVCRTGPATARVRFARATDPRFITQGRSTYYGRPLSALIFTRLTVPRGRTR